MTREERGAALDFWSWFDAESYTLADALLNDSFSSQLIGVVDARVRKLHPELRWELGPAEDARHGFVLSPGRSRKLLSTTKGIVRLAPDLSGWQFCFAKPRKRWDGVLQIRGKGGREFIDVNAWRVALTRVRDTERFHVHVWLPRNPTTFSETGAWLAIENQLGELALMDHVESVMVADSRALSARWHAFGDLRSIVQERVGHSIDYGSCMGS